MFESMTDRLKTVIARAHGEALRRGDPELGPGHLLVALLLVRTGNAYRALKREGLTVAPARRALDGVLGPGPGGKGSGRTAFSVEALVALDGADFLADDLDTGDVDTPHLLIALLDRNGGEAARMLEAMGAPPARVRSETFRILQRQGPLSGASLGSDVRRLLERPEGRDLGPLLARVREAHRTAYRAREWETSARIAGAVSDIAFTVEHAERERWVPYAKERLEEVLLPG